ncbi:conserved hypothetical protein [Ricinus communis]|uniref:Uncharacterized protein n=1 Tax=Ricinus communis TaxID=3988 RepID=B9SNJ9_RICCO|nr:conserved hypothetical protein [Ricinus communis]
MVGWHGKKTRICRKNWCFNKFVLHGQKYDCTELNLKLIGVLNIQNPNTSCRVSILERHTKLVIWKWAQWECTDNFQILYNSICP